MIDREAVAQLDCLGFLPLTLGLDVMMRVTDQYLIAYFRDSRGPPFGRLVLMMSLHQAAPHTVPVPEKAGRQRVMERRSPEMCVSMASQRLRLLLPKIAVMNGIVPGARIAYPRQRSVCSIFARTPSANLARGNCQRVP